MKAIIIPVTPFAQNCSLIWCEETMKGAVTDPGGDLDRADSEARTPLNYAFSRRHGAAVA